MPDQVKRRGCLLLLIALLPGIAWPFGPDPHRIIGHIAAANVCPSTSAQVAALLQGESLAKAGVWADTLRDDREWDKAKPWHYINVPDDVRIVNAKRAKDGDVLWAIDEMLRRLRDPATDPRDQRDALRFLIHFVADVHQPLHVGRKSDLGGNTVDIRYLPLGSDRVAKSNLHRYWDSQALKGYIDDPRAYAARLLAEVAPDPADWQPGEPLEWAIESKALRGEVYSFRKPADGGPVVLDPAYQARAAAILDERLAVAGLRLAALLDGLYCDAEGPGQPLQDPRRKPRN